LFLIAIHASIVGLNKKGVIMKEQKKKYFIHVKCTEAAKKRFKMLVIKHDTNQSKLISRMIKEFD